MKEGNQMKAEVVQWSSRLVVPLELVAQQFLYNLPTAPMKRGNARGHIKKACCRTRYGQECFVALVSSRNPQHCLDQTLPIGECEVNIKSHDRKRRAADTLRRLDEQPYRLRAAVRLGRDTWLQPTPCVKNVTSELVESEPDRRHLIRL